MATIEKSIKAFKDNNLNIKGFNKRNQDKDQQDLTNLSLQFETLKPAQNPVDLMKSEESRGGLKLKRMYDSIDSSLLK